MGNDVQPSLSESGLSTCCQTKLHTIPQPFYNSVAEKKSSGKTSSSAPQDPEQMKEAMLKMEQENKELMEQRGTLIEELELVRQVLYVKEVIL